MTLQTQDTLRRTRWRRGEYRVLYLVEDQQVTVIITSVTHRADAYRTR